MFFLKNKYFDVDLNCKVFHIISNLLTSVVYLDNQEKTKEHPCSILISELEPDKIFSFYTRLVKTTVIHSKCSVEYCLRGKKNGKCRFGFPKNETSSNHISVETKNNNYKFVLAEVRNHPLINSHNIFQLLGWKANVDITVITSKNDLIRYLSKYVTKTEPVSTSLKKFLKNKIKDNNTQSVDSILKSSILNILGRRDMGKQEVCHLLMEIPLYESNISHINVNLNNMLEIKIEKLQKPKK